VSPFTPGEIEQPEAAGEYDAAMQDFLQLVWGDGFLSPGGADEIARLLEGEDISGAAVLDIGAGLGGVDGLLATLHGAGSVVGIDIEPGLIACAEVRIASAGLSDRVRFQCVTPGPLPFPDASFDIVFSKDAVVQIPDKPALFAEIFRVLRPGGRFIASDWLRGGEAEYSAQMLEFFRLEGITYNMAFAAESEAALASAGFTGIVLRDRNAWYREVARHELAQLQSALSDLMTARIGSAKAQHFVENWRQLVLVLDRGELRPCHLKAVKAGA
jgi:phosphoethanolamine N-methyltransferase